MDRTLRHVAMVALALLAQAAGAAVHDVRTPCGGRPGAAGNGVADDTAAIRCHVDAAALPPAGAVYIPSGIYRISQAIQIPGDGVTIRGDGLASQLLSPTGDHDVLAITSRKQIAIRDLSIHEQAFELGSDGFYQPLQFPSEHGVAIHVGGASADILIENVHTRGFASGFAFFASPPDLITDVTLRDVWAEFAAGYGLQFFRAQRLHIYDVRAIANYGSGLKIGEGSRDWEIHGGRVSSNGAHGISTYSGGNRWLISGVQADRNVGAGILVKAGNKTTDEAPSTEGNLVGVMAEHNTQSGLDFWVGVPASEPLPHHVTVSGGSFSRNGHHGIRIGDGRNISLMGVTARGNQRFGIYVRRDSFDISIVAPQVSGNGLDQLVNPTGHYSGIYIEGDRVRVIGAQVNGRDAAAAVGDPAGDSHQEHSIEIAATASDVLVEGCVLRNANGAEIGGSLDSAILRSNVGFASRASGVATLAAAATRATVAHGLDRTPGPDEIQLTPKGDWGSATRFWVGNPTASGFDIFVDRAPGQNVEFAWRLDAEGG